MAIHTEFSPQKWLFSIAMLVITKGYFQTKHEKHIETPCLVGKQPSLVMCEKIWNLRQTLQKPRRAGVLYVGGHPKTGGFNMDYPMNNWMVFGNISKFG